MTLHCNTEFSRQYLPGILILKVEHLEAACPVCHYQAVYLTSMQISMLQFIMPAVLVPTALHYTSVLFFLAHGNNAINQWQIQRGGGDWGFNPPLGLGN